MTAINPTRDQELLLRIKTIMLLRGILLVGLVIMAFAIQNTSLFSGQHAPPVKPLSLMLGLAFVLSLIYAFLLKFLKNLVWVSWIQSVGDMLMISGILFATGSIQSPLTFLNILIIISTSITLPRAACYFIASGASIIFGLLGDLEYFQILTPVPFTSKPIAVDEGGYVFYVIFLHFLSYYSVAFLSAMLSHRLKITREELAIKNLDLEKLREFQRNILRNMGSGLWTTDQAGRITSANPAALQISGYTSEETLNHFCYDLLGLNDLRILFLERQPNHLPLELENDCRRKDGKNIRVRMKISRLSDEKQEDSGFICVFEDMTELRAMERKIAQGEKLAEVGKVSAGLAHEIRNPLASLSGSIQILQKDLNLQGTGKRLMNIVVKETNRLNSIVSDFLNYAHPSRGKKSIMDITQTIQDVVTLIQNDSRYKNTGSIHFNSPADHLLFVGNEKEIKDMVWNLCINGLQSMNGDGHLKLDVKPVGQFARGDFQSSRSGIAFTVEDEGNGIDKENLEKIFDPFFTTKDSGVGLGLAKVFQVVNSSNGYIGVESEPSKGTRFTVFFPNSDWIEDLNESAPCPQ